MCRGILRDLPSRLPRWHDDGNTSGENSAERGGLVVGRLRHPRGRGGRGGAGSGDGRGGPGLMDGQEREVRVVDGEPLLQPVEGAVTGLEGPQNEEEGDKRPRTRFLPDNI